MQPWQLSEMRRCLKILLIGNGFVDMGAQVAADINIHAQSQTNTGLDNGALQKHVITMLGHVTGAHFIRDQVYAAIIAALIGQLSDFSENANADIINGAMYTSHSILLHHGRTADLPPAQLYFNIAKPL